MKGVGSILFLMGALVVLMTANVYFGAVNIPARAVTDILLGHEAERASWNFIIWENRMPQAITALFSGAGLAASGLLLQTAFRNPLAGPSILGIDGGANLGVAVTLLLLGGSLTAGVFSLNGLES